MRKAPQIPPLLTVADLEEKIEQQKRITATIQQRLSDQEEKRPLWQLGLAVCVVGWFIIIVIIQGWQNSQSGTVAVLVVLGIIGNLYFTPFAIGGFFENRRQVSEAQLDLAQQQRILNNWFKEMNNRIECKKFLALYRVRLKEIDYDIQALETLIDEGISPNEFEQTILSIVGPEEEEEMDLATRNKEAQEAKQMHVADFKAKQEHLDAILAALKERKQDIQRRVELGHLTQEEAQILLEAAQRDAEQRIQALEQG